jgi:hypothetical protein
MVSTIETNTKKHHICTKNTNAVLFIFIPQKNLYLCTKNNPYASQNQIFIMEKDVLKNPAFES